MNHILQIDWSELQYAVDDFNRTLYSFPVHIRILIGITVAFLLIVLFLLIVILSSRIYKTRRSVTSNYLRKKYQPVFTRLLFEDDSGIAAGPKATVIDPGDLKTKFNREILLNEIIHLHENFSGETAVRLEQLYTDHSFHLDSLEKMKNKRWYIVAKGMRELALMNVRTCYDDLSKFLNHKNEILRMEARIAMMKLSSSDPLAFLSRINEPLSDYDMANIHSMLSKMPEQSIPDFSAWFNSHNKSVVLFSIMMTGRFRQQDSTEILLRMLDTGDENVKAGVIRALKELNTAVAEDKLVTMYSLESTDIQKEILSTLEVIGKVKTAELMEKILKQPVTDYALSIQAVRTLLASAGDAGQRIIQLVTGSHPELGLIIQHAKDRRL